MFDLFGHGRKLQQLQAEIGEMRRQQNPQNATWQLSDLDAWREAFPDLLSGKNITADAAMKMTAVYACISLLSGTIGSLPFYIEESGDNGSSKRVEDHPLSGLVNETPHQTMPAMVWYEAIAAHALLGGNGYAHIERRQNGRPTALRIFDYGTVTPRRRGNRIRYDGPDSAGTLRGYDQDDIVHFRGSPTWDGLKALSPLKCVSRSVNIGIEADKYAEAYFEHGIAPSGYLTYEGKVTPDMADEIRNYWQDRHGGVKNAHKIAVLSQGGVFKAMMADPESAQLMASRQFQVVDIARAFGLPAHMIGETQGNTKLGSSIESLTSQFYIQTLRRHIKRFEGEMTAKLLRNDRRFAVKANIDSLLRADAKTRAEVHQIALGGNQQPGFKTINEVRADEGLPPVEGGDDLYRPVTGEPNALQSQT